uniref:DNA-directed RNA polymerase n=1 Tax=viral metagenome TaxID=1070528 RepID=A0A6C0C1L5_9ZZZZ
MQPLRCWTCGRSLHGISSALQETANTGGSLGDILDKCKVNRYCCRRFALGELPRKDIPSNDFMRHFGYVASKEETTTEPSR